MVRSPPRERPRISTAFATLVLGAAALLSVLPQGSSFKPQGASSSARHPGLNRIQTNRPAVPVRQPTRRSASSTADAANAAAAASARSGSLANDNNAFRLVQYQEAVELQTAMYKLTRRSSSSTDAVAGEDAEIVLVSMVHLADQDYYTEIMREADSVDRVLFELIVGPEVSGVDRDGNRAVTDYVYPTREQVPRAEHSQYSRVHIEGGFVHAQYTHSQLASARCLGNILQLLLKGSAASVISQPMFAWRALTQIARTRDSPAALFRRGKFAADMVRYPVWSTLQMNT